MPGRPNSLRKVRGHTMIVVGGNGIHFQCSTEISYGTIYLSAYIWGAVSICAMLARQACASSEHLKAKDFRTLIRVIISRNSLQHLDVRLCKKFSSWHH